ncbi:hypothetical protein KBI23_21020 [bacterium]|nr:hypothetical protein [bacterium]MBP9807162.1 hypothetical protein [bacterium]
MPKQDIVTESTTFRAGNDNRASSNSLSSEAWDSMDKFVRNGTSASEGVAAGAKLVGGAAAASAGASRSDSSDNTITKERNSAASEKSGALESGAFIEKRPSVDDLNNDKAKDKDKNKDLDKNNKKDIENDHKKKDLCLDFGVEIKGYPNHRTSDERRSNHLSDQMPQRGEGGSRTAPAGREYLPPSSKIDQEYGQYLNKLEQKTKGH